MRHLAIALFAATACFAVYYPYVSFSFWGPYHFGDTKTWAEWVHWIEDDAIVPEWHPLAHLALWLPTVMITQAMILAGLYFLWRVVRRDLFSLHTVRSIQLVGACGAASALVFMGAQVFEGWLLTLYNTDDIRPIRFVWNIGQITQLLTGAGVFMIGWVLHIAMLRDRENQEII